MPITSTISSNLVREADSGKYWGIAHGCNCICEMRNGIAPQIAAWCPGAEIVDGLTRPNPDKLGGLISTKHEPSNTVVVNLYTQVGNERREGGDVDYGAVRSAFERLEELCPPDVLIGIPKIGSGLGGGDWREIRKIIDEATPRLSLELVEYDGSTFTSD